MHGKRVGDLELSLGRERERVRYLESQVAAATTEAAGRAAAAAWGAEAEEIERLRDHVAEVERERAALTVRCARAEQAVRVAVLRVCGVRGHVAGREWGSVGNRFLFMILSQAREASIVAGAQTAGAEEVIAELRCGHVKLG